MLIIVTNNSWGISTPAMTQHGEKKISDRGQPFGMRTLTINGNDVEESYFALKDAIEYVRKERKPFLLESKVSRLYGHSSATGCNFVTEEEDCLVTFEAQLEVSGILSREKMNELKEQLTAEMLEISQKVKKEPLPDPSTIYDFVYCNQKGRYW
jgi:2-oxoisovalerate dehydrogenase E1 component alpha subunit